MEESKDAEEELPLEDPSQSTSIPLPNSLPCNPHPTSAVTDRKVEDALSLDQKIPFSSGTSIPDSTALVQETSISSENLNEPEIITGNPTTSASESHNIPSPHPLMDQSEAISSPNESITISENSTNLSSQSPAVPHSLPDQILPILPEISKEAGTTTVNSTDSSSEVHGNLVHHTSGEAPISQENSNVSGNTSYITVISPEIQSSPAPHSSLERSSPTSPDISKDLGTASENATSLPSETNSVSPSHSSVNSITLTSPVSSNETSSFPENSTSLSSEIHSIPPPYQPDQVSTAGLDEIQSNNDSTLLGETNKTEDIPAFELNNRKLEVENTPNVTTESDNSSGNAKKAKVNRGIVDTTAPFESVKEAVSRFGGIVDWKAHRAMALERRKRVQLELEKVRGEIPEYRKQSELTENAKAQVLEELDSTKRLIEELKLNLEKAQTEAAQAKQDSELAQLRAVEMEQGITDEASVAAKAQLEVARARHEAAVVELKTVKKELEELLKDYISSLNERDTALKKAEEAVLASKEIEKTVEDLTLELIATKESLESAHAAHLEAEEHRIGTVLARDQDYLTWEKELKQKEEELQKLNEQLLSANDLKEKLATASSLLLSLNSELAAYMESKLHQESGSCNEEDNSLQKTQKELDEVKATIERTKNEVNLLRVAESSLKIELERERAGLATMRQREGMASIAVSSVEAEIERTEEEIKLALEKEKDARGKMVELPKLLQQAAQQANQAKADAQSAKDALRKAREDAEQAKATASTTEIRLHAALKETEAAKASERLARLAIKALQESEGEELSGGVTLPFEEYYTLSKRAHEVEELSNERVTAAVAQIDVAKESESKTLEMLEVAYNEMNEKREALKVALEKAEKAKEGKLGVEQELRKWRAEHEQRRRANNAAQSAIPPKSPARSFESEPKSFVNADTIHLAPNAKVYTMENKAEHDVSELKGRRKKKKISFFPRIVMFLARKKAETL